MLCKAHISGVKGYKKTQTALKFNVSCKRIEQLKTAVFYPYKGCCNLRTEMEHQAGLGKTENKERAFEETLSSQLKYLDSIRKKLRLARQR